MKEVNKHYLDWKEVTTLVNNLCDKIIFYQIDNDFTFKDIFGLQRGGLIPAVMISHQLKIPMTKGTISTNTLIIDDICDSGETLSNFYKKYEEEFAYSFNLKTACLHYKPHTSFFKPTLYSEEFKNNNWIIYPWERIDSKTIQDYKI